MEAKTSAEKVLESHVQSEWRNKIGDLFKFFCNNVFLGQWELARTAVPILVKEIESAHSDIDFVDLLLNVAEYPFVQSLGSPTVPSPHHLSWLCLQELKQLFPDPDSDKRKLIDKLTKDVDFRLTLFQLKDAEDIVVKELYVFFKKHVLKAKTPALEMDFEGGDFLSKTTMNFLKEMMLVSPRLADSVIRALMSEKENAESRANETLQGLYLDCVTTWINKLEEEKNENQSEAELKTFVNNALHILACYNPVPYWNYLQLRQVFSRLLTLVMTGSVPSLSAERILSVISGRKTPYLLDEFCKLFQEVLQMTCAQAVGDQNDPLTTEHRQCLHMLTQVARDACWRDFSISCYKKRVHFLTVILDLSLSLVRTGQFIELQDLLSYLELQPLKPAVLLMGWSHCVSSAHARTLLDTLWDDASENHNPVLSASCRRLAYHLDLIQWCLDRAKPLLESSESSPLRQATELLQGLETHSVLYMLHQSTSLAALDHQEVLQLLTNISADKRKEAKKKSVTFSDESSGSDRSPEPVNVDQQKDIAIFRSFCAIKNVMDAIAFGADNFDHDLMNPVQVKRTVRPKKLHKTFLTDHPVSSSEGEDSSGPFASSNGNMSEAAKEQERENNQHFVESYKQAVTNKLKETKDHLAHLQPLTYRLEVLENIFSLLFVTHQDLCDADAIDFEMDEDQDDSKVSSLDNVIQENLNMSIISEEESVVDDSSFEKSKAESKNVEKKLPSPSTPSIQIPKPASMDYDVPYVDPNRKEDPDMVVEVGESAYFTLSPQHQEQMQEMTKQIQNQNQPTLMKKVKRKRKRLNSEPSPNTLVGFVCNEYLVRDILHLLKDAIADLNVAKFTLSGKSSDLGKRDLAKVGKSSKANAPTVDASLETVLQAHLLTSIQPENLPKRITKLTQIVHEAWWRFQLVAHEVFPRQSSILLTEQVFITDNDIHALPLCEGKVFSPDSDPPNTFATSDTKAQSGKISTSHTLLSQSNILTKMMASPESLLVSSLSKNNPAQASEVMKLFRLTEKTAETCEVSFAETYMANAGRIWDLEPEVREPTQALPKVGKRSVKALSKAAAVGVATATLSNIVEDLLANPCVPPVPKPKSLFARENFSHLFNLDPSAVLMLDLLCTSCRTWDTCSNMLDIVKTKTKLMNHDPRHPEQVTLSSSSQSDSSYSAQRQRSQSPASSSSSSIASPTSSISPPRNLRSALQGISGCSQFVWCLYDLIHAWDSETGSSFSHHSPSARVGLQHHFHSAFSSMKVNNLVSMETTMVELRRSVDRILQVLSGAGDGHNLDIPMDSSFPSPSPSPRGSFSGSTTGSFSGSISSQPGNQSSRTGQKPTPDQHPLHVAVKHLMYVMEKCVPGDGVTQLLLSKEKPVNYVPVKNYLLSLYEHVREMTYLVAECEGKPKEMTSNYFSVLKEGPVSILGRLMFVKKMPPARLESVAEKLSLNLTHTIVYSCCPKIPSKHPPALPPVVSDVSITAHGTRVYNRRPGTSIDTGVVESTAGRQESLYAPEITVRAMLDKLVKLMKDVSSRQSAVAIFDLACAKNLVQLPEYREVVESAQRLKDIDLALLKSGEERLAFYGNLANLMIFHCHMTHIQAKMELQAKLESSGETTDQENTELCPWAAADYIMYLSNFSYQVGQLGVISICDLLTVVSSCGLVPSSQFGKIFTCRKFVLSEEDPWKLFGPSAEPQLIFAINLGCLSSPPVQVLVPTTVKSQLEKAMRDYLCHTVLVSVEQEKICIPELLVWHEQNFVADSPSAKEPGHAALVKWVCQFVSAEKQKQLQQLFNLDSAHENIDLNGRNELPYSIDVDHFDNRFSVVFDCNQVKVPTLSSKPPSAVSKKPKGVLYPLTSSMEWSGRSWNLELPSYNLTPVTLEYVKQDSLLVATMVSLVCADDLDNIEQQFTDDHFNMPEPMTRSSSQLGIYHDILKQPQRSSSDISLVDIRSYRYHRLTDDYPVLQRHLLHYILPLAGADNPELLNTSEPILKFVTNDIDDQVKLCMFSLPDSQQYQCVVQDMSNRLLEEHKWLEILNILHSLPESLMAQQLHLQALHDFALSCWALSQVRKPGYAPKVGDALRKFYNPSLQARTVLSVCNSLSCDLCIDLLDLCMTSLTHDPGLRQAVASKLKEVVIYSKIMDCVKTLRIKLSMKDAPVLSQSPEDRQLSQLIERLSHWTQIATCTQNEPEDVLAVLENVGDFGTARRWAELHKLPQELVKEIRERHLYYLLTLDPPDTVSAFQLLDELRVASGTECLSVCQSLTDRLSRPQDIKFIVGFILQFLTNHMHAEDVEELRLRKIGAKVLMCLPKNLLSEYSHLISCPHLILEQLLMNMKAELAGQIFKQIKLDFVQIKEPKLRVAQDQFNNLLATYASKAIEVNVVQVVVDKPRSESITSSNSSRHDDTDLAASTLKRSSTDRGRPNQSVSPTPSQTSSYSSKYETAAKLPPKSRRDSSRFVMPAQPPSQDQWVPDNATAVCMVCRIEAFSMFNRRHHCRRCGRVVCAACSGKQTVVLGVMSRTCDECYEQIHSSSDHRAQEEHEIYSQRIKDQLSGTSASPTPTPGLTSSASATGLSTTFGPDRLKRNMSAAIHHVHHNWKLRPDSAFSDQVRSEFYYEQAPSVSLCISVLRQHSSRVEAGKLILSMCDKLSSHLVPISPGVPNPEIDYSLIISMMKQLLFQAKIDFLHTNSTNMTAQCDTYLTRVDLLGVMVEANYQDLPTIKELTKQDTVRRLRDKLIADERLPLAMEVSTKCGIDPAGVWSAMGFARLHLGDFQGAREKFARCLKVPADKNQTSAGQSRLLGEVLDFLDTIPSSGLTEVQRLLSDPRSICDIKTLLVPSVGEENRVESVPYQECLHYLRTYGSYMDHINFLRQHSYWMKAVQFAVDHHCSSDVFVHGLMIPAMNSGEMGRLLEQMLMLDPTLEKWILYLTATCKYLLKHKHFYTLYQVQLFMKDYIRAAMTCISHFYQRGARSYLDLSGRLQFLFTAQQHLQAYLDPGQWGSVHHPLAPHTLTGAGKPAISWDKAGPESAARMTLSPEEVKKHVRTIALQIEVTKFLEQCLTQAMGRAGAATPTKLVPGSQVPTLFGQGSARTELVSLIILSGKDVNSGFELAVRTAKECRLNPTVIFTHCSRELAKQGRIPEISTLTQLLMREGLVDDDGIDEIVGASLLVIADSHNQARDESDSLIQLLRNDNNKINAYILCGKLRSAYLLAVKRDRVEDVQRIAGAAQRLGQSAVKNICKKWLEQHEK